MSKGTYTKTYDDDQELGHGNTAKELDLLHQAQKQKRVIATIPGNVDSRYRVPETETEGVHYRKTIPQFDPETGKDNSVSHVVKTNVHMFSERNLWGGNVKIEILHDGRKTDAARGEQGKFLKKDEPVSVKTKEGVV